MIVWLNGAFGTGKTTVARELVDLVPGSTLYDPELVTHGLGLMLPRKRLEEITDFQDLPAWRRLVVETGAAVLGEVPGVLIVPMTLLRQEYRDEIFGGFASRRIPVRHVLLHTEETILRERVAAPDLAAFRAALPWLGEDAHAVDTSALTPRQAAERIAEAVRDGAGACEIVQTPQPSAETLASGVLLFDESDRVLLVDPTYKPGWEFPGGVVEAGEPPARAGVREVAEEVGIELDAVPRLLVVDWEPPEPPSYGGLRLLFDGGRVPPGTAERLALPAAELRAWRFVTEREAAELLPADRFRRLRWALRARERSTVLNLEAGVPAE
ncbi:MULTISPECIES: NUDIX hydrolase [Streptomyces]|uniref:NUDIX domain-containing protein n=1 Tax=Streptomyces lycii TaxID=2654337 RepID=A0ABQ7FQZ4_9ACTN|nr:MULTISPECIES: NUDIX hydrolase [Streptomyces]KAF4411160.1 NUDIX domain-containing protein [Streptomyces lycii]PGH51454.1 ATP/GTP-binding protein [Streptomyces sp. Ru87]